MRRAKSRVERKERSKTRDIQVRTMNFSFDPRQIVRRYKSGLFRIIFDPRVFVRSFCVQRVFTARVALARSVCDYFYHACVEREIKSRRN